MGLMGAALHAIDGIVEPAGAIAGALGAPLAWIGARFRGDRLFHARGFVYDATVTPIAGTGPEAALADRLGGPALVRFSNTWWRERDWPDVLGVAVRFRVGSASARQDLMLATVRRPWTFPWAVATTRWDDFLANDYYAVTRYCAGAMGELEVRVRGRAPETGVSGREERLADAVARGVATLTIEMRRLSGGDWLPIASIRLGEPRPDARAVRFDPFRAGAGLEPRGFVHAMRRAVYAASRSAAPVPRSGA